MNTERHHMTIMIDEVLAAMPEQTSIIVDGTMGHAGHSIAMLSQQLDRVDSVTFIGVDKDMDMLRQGEKRLIDAHGQAIENGLLQSSISCLPYDDIGTILEEYKLDGCDFILLDIGINR
jgi:16S rRNA C1402 N4-methylase RsmH